MCREEEEEGQKEMTKNGREGGIGAEGDKHKWWGRRKGGIENRKGEREGETTLKCVWGEKAREREMTRILKL